MPESRTRQQPWPKHVPQRTCVACRTTSPKRAFVRVVRTPDGRVVVDRTGKLSGRGAYLCQRTECWDAGLKRDRLSTALKVKIETLDREALSAFARALPPDDEER